VNSAEELNAVGRRFLPARLGIRVTATQQVPEPAITVEMSVRPRHLAPHGYVHGGAIMLLADTACGYGALANLPIGATGFLTVESKTNHLGAVRDGTLACIARTRHAGRSTQVWDADVTDLRTGKLIAMFRCTQMLLYSAPGEAAP
jgi:uncharacterized protein (TIGR00369 family)